MLLLQLLLLCSLYFCAEENNDVLSKTEDLANEFAEEMQGMKATLKKKMQQLADFEAKKVGFCLVFFVNMYWWWCFYCVTMLGGYEDLILTFVFCVDG